MKTKKYYLAALFLVVLSSAAYSQLWQWTNTVYDNGPSNQSRPIATDQAGNVYIVGYSQLNTVAIGNYQLNNALQSYYFVKYNSAGAFDWAIAPNDSVIINAIATDKLGNIYLSGALYGSYTTGAFSLKSNKYGEDGYIAKYDSNGNAIWGFQTQVNSKKSEILPRELYVDNSGNIYFAGLFQDTVSIGPYTLTMQNDKFFSNSEIFVAKLAPNGNVLWAEQSKSSSIQNQGPVSVSMAVNNLGETYLTGQFFDSTSFNGYHVVSATPGSYLVKYSSAGAVQWAKKIGAYGAAVSAITCDKAGNISIAGSFKDSVSFLSKTLYGTSQYSVFLAKFNGNGNLVWAEQSSPQWMGNSLASDSRGNLYLGGNSTAVTGSLQFGSFLLKNPISRNASFIVEFDSTGRPGCGSMTNTTYLINAPSLIATDPTGNYTYMSGEFTDTLFYNNTMSIEPNWLFSYSISRWKSCDNPAGVSVISNPGAAMKVYPNPFNNTATVAVTGNGEHHLEIDDLTGRKLQWIEFTGTQYQLSAEGLAKGIYFIRTFDGDMNVTGTNKIVVQ